MILFEMLCENYSYMKSHRMALPGGERENVSRNPIQNRLDDRVIKGGREGDRACVLGVGVWPELTLPELLLGADS